MGFKKEDLFTCVGSVNVLLNNLIVLQGQFERERHQDKPVNVCVDVETENEFVTFELNCNAFIVEDDELETICPVLYKKGDKVKINVSQISVVGPSHKCPDDEEEDCDCTSL